MTPQANQAAAVVARTALTSHCLCLRIETDEKGYLLIRLPDGYSVDAVRVRGMARAEAYRVARDKLEEIWKESLEWSGICG